MIYDTVFKAILRDIERLRGSIPQIFFKKHQTGLATGRVVSLPDLPGFIPLCFVLTEDDYFFSHSGVSWRAMLHRLHLMSIAQSGLGSGSTITQQVVKLAFFMANRNPLLKLREMLYAKAVETVFSKDEILSVYISSVRFGGKTIGLIFGSQHYFAKKPPELTLTEALFLAFAVRSPCAAQISLLRHEHFPKFESFMRVKLFEIFSFYAAAFGLESLYDFERYAYDEVKAGFAKYRGRRTFNLFEGYDYREIEWLVLDHLNNFKSWFNSYVAHKDSNLSPNILKGWRGGQQDSLPA